MAALILVGCGAESGSPAPATSVPTTEVTGGTAPPVVAATTGVTTGVTTALDPTTTVPAVERSRPTVVPTTVTPTTVTPTTVTSATVTSEPSSGPAAADDTGGGLAESITVTDRVTIRVVPIGEDG